MFFSTTILHITSYLMTEYIFPREYRLRPFGLFQIIVFSGFLAVLAFLFISSIFYVGLLGRYKSWAEDILSTAMKGCPVRHYWHMPQYRSMLYKHIVVLSLLCIASLALYFPITRGFSAFLKRENLPLVLFLIFCLWWFKVGKKGEAGNYNARRTVVHRFRFRKSPLVV